MSHTLNIFLGAYPVEVRVLFMKAKALLEAELPHSEQQLDLPAKMLAFTYGSRYSDMVCVLFPSQKGLKIAFSKGVELPDPEKQLDGKGKSSRYVEIKKASDLTQVALLHLIRAAHRNYLNTLPGSNPKTD